MRDWKSCTGGFVAVASPCWDSLATSSAIRSRATRPKSRSFCTDNFDVTFPMFAKTEVNGSNAHPLFKALKQAAPGLLGTQAIKWNFTKFLVDRNRSVVRRYAPTDRPESLAADIEAALA